MRKLHRTLTEVYVFCILLLTPFSTYAVDKHANVYLSATHLYVGRQSNEKAKILMCRILFAEIITTVDDVIPYAQLLKSHSTTNTRAK